MTENFHSMAVFYYVILDKKIVSEVSADRPRSVYHYISYIYTAPSGQAPCWRG